MLGWALTAGCAHTPAADARVAPYDGQVSVLDGEPRAFSSLLRTPTTVLAFATVWCEACEKEWPELVRWAEREKAGVVYVMSGSEAPDVRAAMARRSDRPERLHVVIDGTGALADHYRVQATPTLFFREASGRWSGPQRHFPVPRPGKLTSQPSVEDHGRELGTSYHVEIRRPARSSAHAQADLAAARALLHRLEASLSEWRPGSEISRLNRDGHRQPVLLSAPVQEVLRGALHVAAATDGAFDPTWASLSATWEAARRNGVWPDPAQLAKARAGVNPKHLRLDETSAQLDHPRTQIGVAGVAKGYIIDRVFLFLRERGHREVTVNVGGDLRTSTETQLKVVDPWQPTQAAGTLGIRAVAVATSGNYLRTSVVAGRIVGHILDPRTGEPPSFDGSVTVLTRDAAMADALATALFVMGPEAGLAFAKATPGVDAVYVTREGWRSTLARG